MQMLHHIGRTSWLQSCLRLLLLALTAKSYDLIRLASDTYATIDHHRGTTGRKFREDTHHIHRGDPHLVTLLGRLRHRKLDW